MVQQDFQSDPVDDPVDLVLLDHLLDQLDPEKNYVLDNTSIYPDPVDPVDLVLPNLLDHLLDQEEVSHSNTSSNRDPVDPVDFAKNENLKVDDTNCIIRPVKGSGSPKKHPQSGTGGYPKNQAST
ncbi:hypothetical protein [Nostoc sp.]